MSSRAAAPAVELFDLAVLPPEPWKNQRGVTRVIASEDNGGEVVWRISAADIGGDGPFSLFPGMERHSALLKGEGLALCGDDMSLVFDALGDVHAYSGEASLSAQLGGDAARLLNVMTRRCHAECRMQRHAGNAVDFQWQRGAVLVTQGTFSLFQGDDYITQVHAQQGVVVRVPSAGVQLRADRPDSTLIAMRIDLPGDRA